MDDLVQWLRAQLDDDESAALGAKGDTLGRWTRDDGPPEGIVLYDKSGKLTVGQARHIARHDPARVLREIEAKRRLLDDYTATARIRDEAAERIKAAGDHPDPKDLETWDRAQRESAILEGPVQLAALPFNDRRGYCEEWRP